MAGQNGVADALSVYFIHAALKTTYCKDEITRSIAIDGGANLVDLHLALATSFGWPIHGSFHYKQKERACKRSDRRDIALRIEDILKRNVWYVLWDQQDDDRDFLAYMGKGVLMRDDAFNKGIAVYRDARTYKVQHLLPDTDAEARYEPDASQDLTLHLTVESIDGVKTALLADIFLPMVTDSTGASVDRHGRMRRATSVTLSRKLARLMDVPSSDHRSGKCDMCKINRENCVLPLGRGCAANSDVYCCKWCRGNRAYGDEPLAEKEWEAGVEELKVEFGPLLAKDKEDQEAT